MKKKYKRLDPHVFKQRGLLFETQLNASSIISVKDIGLIDNVKFNYDTKTNILTLLNWDKSGAGIEIEYYG